MEITQALPRTTPLPLFALLETPYGLNNAIATTLPLYVWHAQGVSVERGAAVSALCILPATFYFLYAPLVDFFVRRRSWYLITLACLVLMNGGVILIPAAGHLGLLTVMMFSASILAMLLSAATGGMANALGAERKKNVGAWMQLGNLGGGSLMTGLLVFASSRCTRSTVAMMVMAVILLPGLTALAVDEPKHREPFETFVATMGETWAELKAVFLSWRAVPAILLLLSPIGSGTISNVMMGVTGMYHASAAQVTFANGWGAGLITALGSLCTLLVPKQWNRMLPYALIGLAYGTGSLVIGVLPMTPTAFMVGLLLANFLSGAAYGLFTGVVLQTAGFGGLRHSTRYTILNSAGNVPVVYMMAMLGAVAGRKGIHAAGITDGVCNMATAGLFFLWWAWVKVRKPEMLKPVAVLDEVAAAGYSEVSEATR